MYSRMVGKKCLKITSNLPGTNQTSISNHLSCNDKLNEDMYEKYKTHPRHLPEHTCSQVYIIKNPLPAFNTKLHLLGIVPLA